MAYLGNLKLREQEREKYDGFNLVVMDVLSGEMAYLTNRPLGQHTEPVIVTPGIHGLSNAFLDTPWPKVYFLKLNSSISFEFFGLNRVFEGTKSKIIAGELNRHISTAI